MGNLQGKGSIGAYGSKGTKGPSQSIHLRDKKDLAGVGIIFRKGTDGTLVVKECVGGSSAEECAQIEAGDILSQVDDVKVNTVSIADVSSMILGEPSQPVKLKFTRMVGKSKKKYKIVLKRNVRASLEPTYRVQRDGINTKVTHIHLDCLQEDSSLDAPSASASPEKRAVRDVLDASGNVVGPGLLQRVSTMPTEGVQRLDPSHPAWPGNRGKSMTNMVSSPPAEAAKTSAPAVAASSAPSAVASAAAAPAPERASSNKSNKEEDDIFAQFGLGGDRPLSPSTLDQNYKEESSFVTAPSVPQTPAAAPPAPDPEPEPEPVKPEPVVEPPHPPPAEPAPAVEEEEEEGKQEDPDWSGLAESRVLAWEAKEKKAKAQAKGVEEKKPVDLEKEWARTAAAKQGPVSSGSGGGEEDKPAPARPASPPAKEEKAPTPPSQPVSSGSSSWKKPLDDGPIKSARGTEKPKEPPKKLGAKTGGGDLAAMMAARKKAMDENDDDGYYF